jgi:hypothetical protein
MSNQRIQKWSELNALVMSTTDEAELTRLLNTELGSPAPRKVFVFRIKSRLNKVRGARERGELLREISRR